MKPKKINKKEVQEEINKIFSGNPCPKDIKKAKSLAMSKNIKLGNLRKKFCKKCYSLFDSKNSSIKIKKPFKIINCKNCGFTSRYKMYS